MCVCLSVSLFLSFSRASCRIFVRGRHGCRILLVPMRMCTRVLVMDVTTQLFLFELFLRYLFFFFSVCMCGCVECPCVLDMPSMRRKASGAADGEARWGRLTTARQGRFSRWNGPPSVICLSFLFFPRFCPLLFRHFRRVPRLSDVRVSLLFFLLWRRRGGASAPCPPPPLPPSCPSSHDLAARPLTRSPRTRHMCTAQMEVGLIVGHSALSLRRPWRSSACERSPHPFPRIVPLWDAAKPPGRRSDENGKGRRERGWDALPLIETTRARTCLSVNLRVGAHKPRRCPAQADRQQERTWSGMCVALSNVCLWLRVSLSGRCCGLRVRCSLSCFG